MKFYRVLFIDAGKYGGRIGEAFLCQGCRDLHDEHIAAAVIEDRWENTLHSDKPLVFNWLTMSRHGVKKDVVHGAVMVGSEMRCDDCSGLFSILRDR